MWKAIQLHHILALFNSLEDSFVRCYCYVTRISKGEKLKSFTRNKVLKFFTVASRTQIFPPTQRVLEDLATLNPCYETAWGRVADNKLQL